MFTAQPFQFHKGTIKTTSSAKANDLRSAFQFHKGTIKTLRCLNTLMAKQYFNSIKVRLKRHHGGTVAALKTFQFHKGTIKTQLRP
mgnify:CR=1 FL=1